MTLLSIGFAILFVVIIAFYIFLINSYRWAEPSMNQRSM